MLTLLLLACGSASLRLGDDTAATTGAGAPDIELVDPLVEFTGAVDPQGTTATVTVRNAGTADLVLEPPVNDDTSGTFTVSALSSSTIAPGAEATFTITYVPAGEASTYATIYVISNDPDEATVNVTVVAQPELPSLVIDPSTWDFGAVAKSCDDTKAFTLTNYGTAPLTITGISATGGDDAYTVTSLPALPLTLAASEATSVTVAFSPPWLGGFSGSLVVTSDDPENPTAAASLDGEGVDDTETEDAFTVSGGTVDVVVSVYQGDSMDAEEEDLLDAAPAFLAALDDAALDWRLTLLEDDDGCVAGDDVFISADMSGDERESVYAAMLADDFVAVHGMTMLEDALDADRLDAGGCNEGLVRDGARLALVGITDQGGQPTGGWEAYLDELSEAKSDPDDVVIHGLAPNGREGCGSWQSSGWWEAAEATEGLALPICDDMEDNLAQIVGAMVSPQTEFVLSREPDPDTIVVSVEGDETVAWEWIGGLVRLDDDVAAAGDTVVIVYDALSACE
jgi:hypothetical protein